MTLHCRIDLHATNSVIAVLYDQDKVQLEDRLSNDLALTLELKGLQARYIFDFGISKQSDPGPFRLSEVA